MLTPVSPGILSLLNVLAIEAKQAPDSKLIIETRLGPRFCPSASRLFYSWPLPFQFSKNSCPLHGCVVPLFSRLAFKLCKTSLSHSFITFECHLLVMPIQKSTWAYVPSNADDEGEVFDLPQTPNRPQPAIYSHGTHDSMTANAVIRLLDADGNQGIMDDGQGVVVSGLRKTVILWDHQKAGVAWMRQREQGGKGGGIVADEMG